MPPVSKGDVVHWSVVWGHEIDAWGVVVSAEGYNFKMLIVKGCSIVDKDGKRWTWGPDQTVHLDVNPSLSHSVDCEIIADDQVPNFIWAAIAKQALLGGESG